MEMTAERWLATERYIRELFGREEGPLAGLMARAVAAGLPDIAISPETGRLLRLLARTTNGGQGARRALELGTLAGYSAMWIAGGLCPGGRLIALEPNARHADFAELAIGQGGMSERIEVRRERALDAFPRLSSEFGPASFDFILADAIKTEYSAYFEFARGHLAPGGVFAAHNALGAGSWWIDHASTPESELERRAVDRFNRRIAEDDAFDAVILPTHQGLLVARRLTEPR